MFNRKKLKLREREVVQLKLVEYNNSIEANQKFSINQNKTVELCKTHKKTFPTNKYKLNKLIRKYHKRKDL